MKTHEDNKNGVLPVDGFISALEGLGVPLTEEEWPKLMKIYDKKGEGSINWDDLMSDHKYVHAVSHLLYTIMEPLYSGHYGTLPLIEMSLI